MQTMWDMQTMCVGEKMTGKSGIEATFELS